LLPPNLSMRSLHAALPIYLSHTLNPSGQPFQIFNPVTGLPFANNAIPVSPQAQALLKLYPMPNVVGNTRYNYQVPIIANMHQDRSEEHTSELQSPDHLVCR